jgi:CheY-like chemotaxis protein
VRRSRLGAEAIDVLGRERFDAVVSDYRMPRAGGLELLAYVRRRFPGLPFVLMSGLVGTELRASGADAVFDKSDLLELLGTSNAEHKESPAAEWMLAA